MAWASPLASLDCPFLCEIGTLEEVTSKVQNGMVSVEVDGSRENRWPVGPERCKKEWQTFMLLSVILNCQVQQREEVVII